VWTSQSLVTLRGGGQSLVTPKLSEELPSELGFHSPRWSVVIQNGEFNCPRLPTQSLTSSNRGPNSISVGYIEIIVCRHAKTPD